MLPLTSKAYLSFHHCLTKFANPFCSESLQHVETWKCSLEVVFQQELEGDLMNINVMVANGEFETKI